jgi:hypothetical protein
LGVFQPGTLNPEPLKLGVNKSLAQIARTVAIDVTTAGIGRRSIAFFLDKD